MALKRLATRPGSGDPLTDQSIRAAQWELLAGDTEAMAEWERRQERDVLD